MAPRTVRFDDRWLPSHHEVVQCALRTPRVGGVSRPDRDCSRWASPGAPGHRARAGSGSFALCRRPVVHVVGLLEGRLSHGGALFDSISARGLRGRSCISFFAERLTHYAPNGGGVRFVGVADSGSLVGINPAALAVIQCTTYRVWSNGWFAPCGARTRTASRRGQHLVIGCISPASLPTQPGVWPTGPPDGASLVSVRPAAGVQPRPTRRLQQRDEAKRWKEKGEVVMGIKPADHGEPWFRRRQGRGAATEPEASRAKSTELIERPGDWTARDDQPRTRRELARGRHRCTTSGRKPRTTFIPGPPSIYDAIDNVQIVVNHCSSGA